MDQLFKLPINLFMCTAVLICVYEYWIFRLTLQRLRDLLLMKFCRCVYLIMYGIHKIILTKFYPFLSRWIVWFSHLGNRVSCIPNPYILHCGSEIDSFNLEYVCIFPDSIYQLFTGLIFFGLLYHHCSNYKWCVLTDLFYVCPAIKLL